jgi:putative membrane protein
VSLQSLSLVSTTFIVLSGASLLVGWFFIRWQRRQRRHKRAMLSATLFAALFLVAYVSRWYLYGSKPFEGEGAWRSVYLAVLAPHVVLAILVGPLALYLIYLAARRRDFATHRRWGRVTVPVWLFVAASGWVVYFMLYHLSF